MPMPGSQTLNSVGVAYFLYDNRWIFRLVLGLGVIGTMYSVFKNSKWWKPALLLLPTCLIIYLFNFVMKADKMFYQPSHLLFSSTSNNKILDEKLIIGVDINGQYKAYPIQLIAYHHQVQDTIGGRPIMVTYCSVCRTGRVFEPLVNNKKEKFRLVGMNNFNAMFEDETTGSWWRQVTGEAIAGKLKGQHLPELFCNQMSLKEWVGLHPTTLIMQPDSSFENEYLALENFESGKSKSSLTGTNANSWQNKSWVVGLDLKNGTTIAYDWNRLKKEKIIFDKVDHQNIALFLLKDEKSFFALHLNSVDDFVIKNDTIIYQQKKYKPNGEAYDNSSQKLLPILAVQEFWHSWKTFHSNTLKH
jgi:hypothetical protein